MSYLEHCQNILKTNGYRITQPRCAVLEILNAQRSSMNAYDIANAINKEASIDVVTVYRILKLFHELGLVHYIASQNRYLACQDWQCTNNDHCHHQFICNSCDIVLEIHVEDNTFLKNIQTQHPHINILQHNFEFSGLCQSCAKQ